jgi:hypothetical protein
MLTKEDLAQARAKFEKSLPSKYPPALLLFLLLLVVFALTIPTLLRAEHQMTDLRNLCTGP